MAALVSFLVVVVIQSLGVCALTILSFFMGFQKGMSWRACVSAVIFQWVASVTKTFYNNFRPTAFPRSYLKGQGLLFRHLQSFFPYLKGCLNNYLLLLRLLQTLVIDKSWTMWTKIFMNFKSTSSLIYLRTKKKPKHVIKSGFWLSLTFNYQLKKFGFKKRSFSVTRREIGQSGKRIFWGNKYWVSFCMFIIFIIYSSTQGRNWKVWH